MRIGSVFSKALWLYVVGLAVLVLVGAGLYAFRQKTELNPGTVERAVSRVDLTAVKRVRLGEAIVEVTIAATPTEQAQGLSGQTTLAPDQGMLFPIEVGQRPAFWMRDMLLPIDIIWINQGRVIGLVERAPVPASGQEAPLYRPDQAVDAVLEVVAGFAEANQVSPGTSVEYINGTTSDR